VDDLGSLPDRRECGRLPFERFRAIRRVVVSEYFQKVRAVIEENRAPAVFPWRREVEHTRCALRRMVWRELWHRRDIDPASVADLE
jgi:hypothetical protein